ncbi:MAG: SRPBCC family protein [Steroidobacteraceae bacterium]
MPEIRETAEVKVDTDTLWKEVGGFGAVGDWHPMLQRVDVVADGSEATRIAHGNEGSEQVERLTHIDPSQHAYQYRMERSALPVRDYVGRFQLEPLGANASRVIWSAQFDLADGADGKTIESVRQFLHAGTESLKRKYGAMRDSSAE